MYTSWVPHLLWFQYICFHSMVQPLQAPCCLCVFPLCNTESIITAAPCRNSNLGCIHFWKHISLSRLQGMNSQGWKQDSVATTQWHSLGTQRTCSVSERTLWSFWTVCWQEKRVLLSSLENMCRPHFANFNAIQHIHIPPTVMPKLLPQHKALMAYEFSLSIP